MSVFKYVRDAAFQKKIFRKSYGWEILVFCPQKMENNRKQLRKVSNQNEQLNFKYRYFS